MGITELEMMLSRIRKGIYELETIQKKQILTILAPTVLREIKMSKIS